MTACFVIKIDEAKKFERLICLTFNRVTGYLEHGSIDIFCEKLASTIKYLRFGCQLK